MSTPPHPTLDTRGLPPGYAFKPDWEVTPRQVRDLLNRADPSLLLVDCRRPDEWDVARIRGAVLLPLWEIEQRAAELETEDGSRNRPIIVHCHHGVRSMKAAGTLRAMGFTDVRSMAGGIDLWSIDVDQGVPRY